MVRITQILKIANIYIGNSSEFRHAKDVKTLELRVMN
jgi:hypothetical protein